MSATATTSAPVFEPTFASAPSPSPVAAPTPVQTEDDSPPRRRLFTVAEFERMAELSILADQERVELIEGEIVVMSRIKSRHARCTSVLARDVILGLGKRAYVSVQNPIRLSDMTEPEPDLAVARPRDDEYATAHPTPADLLLVIEVMETSADYDRRVKPPLYAREGIPETWLVDLDEPPLIEVYRRPNNGRYTEMQTYFPGQTIAPEAFPDVVLAVDDILGRALKM